MLFVSSFFYRHCLYLYPYNMLPMCCAPLIQSNRKKRRKKWMCVGARYTNILLLCCVYISDISEPSSQLIRFLFYGNSARQIEGQKTKHMLLGIAIPVPRDWHIRTFSTLDVMIINADFMLMIFSQYQKKSTITVHIKIFYLLCIL